jgi:hypothetical protein
MHARVAVQIPDYPFSDSFITEFSEVPLLNEGTLCSLFIAAPL